MIDLVRTGLLLYYSYGDSRVCDMALLLLLSWLQNGGGHSPQHSFFILPQPWAALSAPGHDCRRTDCATVMDLGTRKQVQRVSLEEREALVHVLVLSWRGGAGGGGWRGGA